MWTLRQMIRWSPLALFIATHPVQAQAEVTRLSESCNKTDTTIVWFAALYQTVILTTTTQDGPDGNWVARQLTFQDGRHVDLPIGSNFLYDAVGISCDTYIAVAKSSVIQALASGQKYAGLHDDYKALIHGEQPCASPEQSEACYGQDTQTLHLSDLSVEQRLALNEGTQFILNIREHPFGSETYALSWPDLTLTHIFYEGA